MVIHPNTSTSSGPPAPSCAAHVPAAGQARRILVVDDDPDMRHLLFHLLRAEGYRVACAVDGEAAWDALAASSFDAMITDNDMPRLDGLGLLRRVRAGSSRLPVILISGNMPWHHRDLGQLLSPGLAIDKPFNLTEFLVRVRDTFGCALRTDARPGKGGGLPCRSGRPPSIVDRLA